jgi:hypothetical protein
MRPGRARSLAGLRPKILGSFDHEDEAGLRWPKQTLHSRLSFADSQCPRVASGVRRQKKLLRFKGVPIKKWVENGVPHRGCRALRRQLSVPGRQRAANDGTTESIVSKRLLVRNPRNTPNWPVKSSETVYYGASRKVPSRDGVGYRAPRRVPARRRKQTRVWVRAGIEKD